MKLPIKYKMFSKLLMSFIVITSAVIVLLSVILYSVFSYSNAQDLNKYNINNLNQKDIEFGYLSTQIDYISYQLLNRNVILNYFYSDNAHTSVNEYRLALFAKDLSAMYPFISYMEFYNSKTQKYYNTLDFPQENLQEIKENSLRLIEQEDQGESYTIRKFVAQEKTQNVLSIVIRDYVNRDTSIVLNIHLEYVRQLLGPPTQNNSYLLLLDQNRNLISTNNSSLILSDIPDLIDIDRIYSNGEQGYTTKSPYGDYIVNYVKCSSFDWYIVSAMQYDLANAHRNLYFRICVLSALGFILLGCIAVTIMSQIIYSPFKKLLSNLKAPPPRQPSKHKFYDETELIRGQINSLQQKVDQANTIVNQTQDATNTHILTSLLTGKKLAKSKGMLSFSDKLRYFLEPRTTFRVLLFEIDSYQDLSRLNSAEDMDLYGYGISNIIDELLQEHGRVETLLLSPDRICAILSGKNTWEFDNTVCGRISSACFQYIGSTLSAFIGNFSKSIDAIPASYQSCLTCAAFKFILGNGCIADRETLTEYSQLKETCSYDYVKGVISLLFRDGSCGTLLKNTEEFVQALAEVTPSAAKRTITQFTPELKKSLLKNINLLNMPADEVELLCRQLEEATTLEAFHSSIQDILNLVCSATEKSKNSTAQKHYKLIASVEEYVSKNYADPTLSLTGLADVVNVSPGYLGKLFTHVTDKSLVQYINSVRIENAKLKLITTDLPAFQIAEEIGIFNPTYFTTLFKNTVGCTPSVYREKNRLSPVLHKLADNFHTEA